MKAPADAAKEMLGRAFGPSTPPPPGDSEPLEDEDESSDEVAIEAVSEDIASPDPDVRKSAIRALIELCRT